MKETYGVFLYVTIKGGTRHLERKQSLAHAQINSSEKNKHYLLTTISHNLPSNTPGVSYSLGNSSQLLGLKMLRRVWLWVIWFNAQNEIIAGHRTLSDQNCSLSGCTWNVQITCPAEIHWVTTDRAGQSMKQIMWSRKTCRWLACTWEVLYRRIVQLTVKRQWPHSVVPYCLLLTKH
jgi:hypothetical protein